MCKSLPPKLLCNSRINARLRERFVIHVSVASSYSERPPSPAPHTSTEVVGTQTARMIDLCNDRSCAKLMVQCARVWQASGTRPLLHEIALSGTHMPSMRQS